MFSLFQNEDDEEEELAEQAHKQKLLDMISSQPKVCSSAGLDWQYDKCFRQITSWYDNNNI